MIPQITDRISPCPAKQRSYPRVHVEMMSHFFVMLFTPIEKKIFRLFPYGFALFLS